MSKKLLTTLTAILILFSTIAIAIQPASASPGIELQSIGDATAEWSTTYAHTGSYSVKLTGGTDAFIDWAGVWVPVGKPFSDISSDHPKYSVYYYVEGTGTAQVPCIAFVFEDVDGKTWKLLEHATGIIPGPTEWVSDSLEGNVLALMKGSTYERTAVYYDTETDTWGDYGAATKQSISAWQAETVEGATVGERTVDYVEVSVGSEDLAVWVDDITINGVVYPLEPDPITLNPTSGSTGIDLDVMAGEGSFIPSTTVDIYFDANNDTIYTPGERILPAPTSDSIGGLYTSFAVPEVTAGYGKYRVYATDGTNYYIAFFTVGTPVIAISPDKGTAKTPLSVDINYFTKTEAAGDVMVFFDTNNNGVPDAGDVIVTVPGGSLNNTGGATTSLTVPEGVGYGAYGIIATNVIDQTASTTFTVMEPVIAIYPTSGIAGVDIDVTVNYYNKTTGAAPTYVFFDTDGNGKWDDGEPKKSTPGDFTLNATGGNDVPVKLTVPTVTPGDYKVYGNNTLGQVTYATYTVEEPVIMVTKYPKGVPGTPVEVKINYFSKEYDVMIGYDIDKDGDIEDAEIVLTVPEGELNATGGTDDARVATAPDALGYGDYVINATNIPLGGTQSATTTFTVMQPLLEITPEKGTAASPVDAKVYWFNKTVSPITVWIDVDGDKVIDPGEKIVEITAGELDYTGNATKSGDIPDGVDFGVWTVNASNPVQYATDTFEVMSPVLSISPDKGTAGTEISVEINYYNKTTGAAPTYVFFDTDGNGKWDDGEPKKSTPGDFTLNATGGNAAPVTLPVPDSVVYGDYKVYGNNTLGQVVYKTFTVEQPVLAIEPTSGMAGSTISASINYFNMTKDAGNVDIFFDEDVDGIWDPAEVGVTVAWDALDNTGGYETSLTVPSIPTGTYRVYAENAIVSIYQEFTVVSEEIIGIEELEAKLDQVLGNLTSTTFGLSAIKDAVDDIKAKLDDPDSGLAAIKTSIDDGFSALTVFIEEKVGVIVGKLDAIDLKLDGITAAVELLVVDEDASGVPDFIEEITAIEAKLDDPVYGLAAIKAAIDAITVEVDLTPVLTAIDLAKADILAAVSDVGVKIDAIKAKTDTIVWADVTAIKTAVETDIPATLTAIKAKTDTIVWTDIADIKTAVDAIGTKLDSPVYGLSAIKTAIEAISVEVDLTPVLDAIGVVEGKVDTIKAKTDAIVWTDITAIKTAVDLLVVDADLSGVPDFIEEITAIKAAIEAITVEVDLTPVLTAIDTAEADIIADIDSKLTAERLANIDLIGDPLWGIMDIQGNIDAIWYRVDLILADLDSWFGTGGTYSKTAQVSVAKGTESAIGEGVEATLYEVTDVSAIQLTVKITTAGDAEVRFYTDPATPTEYVVVASGTGDLSWSGSGAAWKVTIISTASYDYTFALTSTYPAT